MPRITFQTDNGLAWFNTDSATRYGEDTDWDGHNQISVNTKTQWDHETLYRTAGGRWVLCWYSDLQGTMARYEFIDDEPARAWLIHNGKDEVAEQYFGEIEEERGPGHPVTVGGKPINIQFGGLLPRIEAYAARLGKARAEVIRELVDTALTAEERRATTTGRHPS